MTHDLIRTIHASPLQLVIAVTGGGSLAISDLLTEPGASQTVLEALVPYGESALGAFLGHQPEQCCSEKTARRMAMAAFRRFPMSHPPNNLIGVGCTCSLAGDRPKRGEHRVHWAVQSAGQTLAASVVFEKEVRSRLAEERLVADLLIETIAASAGTTDDPAAQLQRHLRPGETVTLQIATAPDEVRDVLIGNRATCRIVPNDWPNAMPSEQNVMPNAGSFAARSTGPAKQFFLFPGSFDPMHRGHRRMVEYVRKQCCLAGVPACCLAGAPACCLAGVPACGQDAQIALEITVHNVDKPPLDYIDVQNRITSIAQTPGMADVPVWLTRFPRFADKSDFFHGVTFIVGADTIKRIAKHHYYCDAVASTEAAIDRLIANGCRFLCFARKNADGELETIETLDLPDALREIVDFVSASEFCDDISSTQLRTR